MYLFFLICLHSNHEKSDTLPQDSHYSLWKLRRHKELLKYMQLKKNKHLSSSEILILSIRCC